MEVEGSMIGQATTKALTDRHIDVEVCRHLGLHAIADGAGGEALCIPYLRKGTLVNRKYRTLGATKKFWQDAGGVQCFWNEDCLRDDALIGEPIIITEGELDAVAAIQCGFKRVVSVPGGAPDKPIEGDSAKYKFLTEIRELLTVARASTFILAVDNDGPGANLLQDLSVRLGRFRCKFVTYPKDPKDDGRRLKDLNEVLQIYGPKGVKMTIERAQWLRVDGVFRMSELPPAPHAPIYDIGMGKLGDHYKVRLGDLAVFTGIPSHGKSSVVNDICCRVAKYHGLKTGFASFEQMPQRDHRRNLRTWYCGKPTTVCDDLDLKMADKWIDDQFAFMVPSEDEDVSLEWVLDKAEAAVVQHSCKIIVIDPWNEMDHSRDRAESLTEYTGRAIKALRRFARQFMVHLIIVAHPAKQQKDPKTLQYQIPTLYDISDSAHWYNKCDLGVVVHRMEGDISMIRVAKSRYHDEIGVPGDVQARYTFAQRTYTVLD
ncbi:Archaeal primase DnaG/twinkle, TOPRIM domain [uncultured Caudovirales phage]|uniref:Archaeal primase DnaG/twinkle, TOPRIM domain n=1 Tax=uncultured Caudovirales phage TaxID=2100421 RepID=A0A6J5LFI3_9CAUD|nr:Archaeal primase DnaG/twinkle, TOPRIM domain [uncultured Caudovirales phage]